ncbi:MAG: cytochrome C552 [Deltaproteobacteria bacterium]|nr:cytochrome C552 [Deltaproteobacteria bacterium]MBW2307564.1 cytochrome C552 [Deltaproteobacteria bacterium]
MNRSRPCILLLLFIISCLSILLPAGPQASPLRAGSTWNAPEGEACIECHRTETPGLVEQWRLGAMGQAGVNCYDCHRAGKGEPDAMEHEGFVISLLVTPLDCSRCHEKEFKEQQPSHHAKGGQILNTLDNWMGDMWGGPAAVAVGCRQCHGSKIEVLPGGKLDPATWPNTGIGRINPDDSLGSCSACHTRHRFSKRQAREPETCGKCHLGPDHPQREVYEESKHGILYYAFKHELNMERNKWVVGVDYSDAPTCASCHMSATPNQDVTHEVGERLSWNLRAPISVRMKDWKQKRANMEDVCKQCHSGSFVSGFYRQFDGFVELYNTKFAIPAAEIRKELTKKGKLSAAPFDDPLDLYYWELWHHEGRRARHGASMSGPDYAWWHGMYDVAKNFYFHFLPEVEKVAGKELAQEILQKHVYSKPEHSWLKEGMTKEELKKIRQYYQKRYGQ